MCTKSAIYTANVTAQTLAVGDTINPGATIRRYGSNIRTNGSSIVLAGTGYYKVDVSVTLDATAIGAVGIELLKDGLPVTGATASETATGGGDAINLSFSAIVRNVCCAASGLLTVALTDGAATVNNIAVVVTKE